MTNSRAKSLLRKITCIFALILASCYAFFSLRGKQGVPVVREKRRQIRALQDENARLERENQRKRDRIMRLGESRSEQELEIRQRLKLLKEKETTFIIQDQQK